MNSEHFVYWLQGLFELGGDSIKTLDEKQVKMIKEHLHYVFTSGMLPTTQPVVVPVETKPAPTTTQPWPSVEEIDRLRKDSEERNKRWRLGGGIGIGGYPGLGGTVVC